MIRLLGRSSSINVRKVLWTLRELNASFELEEWGSPDKPLQSATFLAINPFGLVPVLQHGDLTLCESHAICRYLAAHFQRDDLLPAHAAARAQVEQWMDWQAAELNPAWRYAFMGLVRQSPAHEDPEAIRSSVQTWNRLMTLLDARLGVTGAYVAGATFTLADIPVGLSVHRWHATPMERPPLPAVAAYYERLSERPGFREHGRNGLP